MSAHVNMKDSSRKTQDGIIIAFIAIFCSFYWTTIIWPYIQQRIDLHKAKSAAMEKLKMRQLMEDENSPVEETIDDVTSPTKVHTKQPKMEKRRFNIVLPAKSIDNQGEQDISSAGGDSRTHSEENNLSPVNSTVGKFTIPRTDKKEVAEIDNDEGINEIDEIDEVAVSSHIRYRSYLRSPSSSSAAAGIGSAHPSETESEFITEEIAPSANEVKDAGSSTPSSLSNSVRCERKTDSLPALWGHISRTATTFDDTSGVSSLQSNPWDSNHFPGSGASFSSSARPAAPAVAMTYAEARNLRVLQDEEYSASIRAERNREQHARQRADLEV